MKHSDREQALRNNRCERRGHIRGMAFTSDRVHVRLSRQFESFAGGVPMGMVRVLASVSGNQYGATPLGTHEARAMGAALVALADAADSINEEEDRSWALLEATRRDEEKQAEGSK